jgi:hypothetical protein
MPDYASNDPRDWWPAEWGAAPLYATRRNLALRTEGPQVRVVARSLRTPLLPWQSYTADVANERRPDGSYEYQVVIVTVPRQTGKTTLIRANGVHSCLVCGQDVFYTAQTGKDARARWNDLVKGMRTSPTYAGRIKAKTIKVSLRAGAENVEFPTGAGFHAFAPTAESLHGYTPHKVKLDEAFKHSATTGELLMGAIEPAQFTVVDKQLWIVSTAGTAESTFLHDWIDTAMDGAPRVALFYWGAREDQSPYDLADIAQFHPGVGFQLGDKLITPDDVLAASGKTTRAEYERAYGNRRTKTSADRIPADEWMALSWDSLDLVNVQPPATTGRLHLVYDVAQDRQSAGIVAVWRTSETHVRIKALYHAPGTAWLADKVQEFWKTLRPGKVRAAGNGPVLDVNSDLAGRVPVDVLTEAEFARASMRFLTMVEDRTVDHDGSRQLAECISGLAFRPAVTDGEAISRKASIGDVSLGVAAAIGTWSAATTAVDDGPLFQLGDTAA